MRGLRRLRVLASIPRVFVRWLGSQRPSATKIGVIVPSPVVCVVVLVGRYKGSVPPLELLPYRPLSFNALQHTQAAIHAPSHRHEQRFQQFLASLVVVAADARQSRVFQVPEAWV
jgi:phage gp37-like protein